MIISLHYSSNIFVKSIRMGTLKQAKKKKNENENTFSYPS